MIVIGVFFIIYGIFIVKRWQKQRFQNIVPAPMPHLLTNVSKTAVNNIVQNQVKELEHLVKLKDNIIVTLEKKLAMEKQ